MKKRLTREQLIVAECYSLLHEQNGMDISKIFHKNNYYVKRMRSIFKEKFKGKFYNLYINSLPCYIISLISALGAYYVWNTYKIPLSYTLILFCFIFSILEFLTFKGWKYYIGQYIKVKNSVKLKCRFYFPYFVIKRIHICKYRGNICIYDDKTIPSDCYIQASYFCDYSHINDVLYDYFNNQALNSIANVRKIVSYRIWEDYCNIISKKWED